MAAAAPPYAEPVVSDDEIQAALDEVNALPADSEVPTESSSPPPDPPSPPPPPGASAETVVADEPGQDVKGAGESWCSRMALEHGVVPRHSWGTLPAVFQLRWAQQDCDREIGGVSSSDNAADDEPVDEPTAALPRRRRRRRRRRSADDPAQTSLQGLKAAARSRNARGADGERGIDTSNAAAECARLRKVHDVRPGTSWGTLTQAGQRQWRILQCDKEDPELQRTRQVEATYLNEYATRLRDALTSRPAARRIVRPKAASAPKLPVVSVCVCTTSRHTEATQLDQLALFSIMLPSLRDTLLRAARDGTAVHHGGALSSLGDQLQSWFSSELSATAAGTATAATAADADAAAAGGDGAVVGGEQVNTPWSTNITTTPTVAAGAAAQPSSAAGSPGAGGFEYWLYVLFDAGDTFFDTPAREAEVRDWITHALVTPLQAASVTLRFALLRFENVLRKPGPAFNFMMAAASEDGAEYLYRVNDDTEFLGAGWASQAVSALQSFDPPNVGIIGPVCHEGNTAILTHDFVHRTHLQIFEHYYPPIFSDWWMDDWITHVYGPSRTRRGPFVVRHRIGHQGTRYEVDQTHQNRLQTELQSGKQRIERWLLKSAA